MKSEKANPKLTCGHADGVVCVKCAEKEFNRLTALIKNGQLSCERLEERVRILQDRNDKPLCWFCKFGTVSRIIMRGVRNSEPSESWKPSESSEESFSLWQIVCHYPGYHPGLPANKFTVTHVSECNHFEPSKNSENM